MDTNTNATLFQNKKQCEFYKKCLNSMQEYVKNVFFYITCIFGKKFLFYSKYSSVHYVTVSQLFKYIHLNV